jgi:hypothetical protein
MPAVSITQCLLNTCILIETMSGQLGFLRYCVSYIQLLSLHNCGDTNLGSLPFTPGRRCNLFHDHLFQVALDHQRCEAGWYCP